LTMEERVTMELWEKHGAYIPKEIRGDQCDQ
jgi:hypothetical protein